VVNTSTKENRLKSLRRQLKTSAAAPKGKHKEMRLIKRSSSKQSIMGGKIKAAQSQKMGTFGPVS